ncbi:outer membrane beta-barrel family protein [Maribacter aestuarii]|uniref:outer membrane beta-barrel family protein n=1 Tax=Maribacter aestuarii TaxID=1130723 RepID=UPI0025A6876F|nr:outer membrane beta-barrel family protein [Maribacter aestuarii]
MKRELRLFSIFVLFVSLTIAQDFKISGTVLDGNEAPLVFASVLLQTEDSVLIKGTATDEKGFFQLDNIAQGNYLLAASFIENRSEILPLSLTGDTDIGSLIILENAQALDEVVVAYKKPTIEQKVDRLVFNIENTALSDSDIWNVLKRTPGVVVIKDELTIKGSSNIGIMINGRLVNIPQSDIINLLSGSSAGNVEAIEVITNPPAKYSAEGGLLIDIKMKKNLIAGYNGSLYNRYTQGVFPKHTVGTDHFFKGKRTDFSINYSFRNAKTISRFTDITNFFEDSTVDEVWSAEQSAVTRRKQHNVSAFLDFELNDKNTISLSTINTLTPSVNRFYDSETVITDTNGTLISSFDTTNDSDYDLYNTSIYLDWAHRLDKKGAEIAFNTHYTNYEYDRGQLLNTDFFDADGTLTGENDFTTQSGQLTGLFSIQLDYSTPVGKSSELEAGLRYAAINSDNTISQEGFDRNQPGINPTETGVFSYDEDISAAYISFNSGWNNWEIKMGLRAEYTETIGLLDTEEVATENNYLEFFPSFSLRHTLNTKHSFGLNYYRRITRPRYNRLNPFQYFQTNNSVVEGNPNLLPSTRNYISLGYTFDKAYNLEFFFGERKNQYLQQVFQDNDSNLLRFISTNLGLSRSYGADFSLNKEITDFWNTFFLVSYFYEINEFTDLGSGAQLNNDVWTGHIRTTNSFTFLSDKSLFADLTFTYFSPTVNGNSRQDSYNQLGFALRKTIWNKNASISLEVEDIFNQGNLFNTRRYLNQDNTSSFRPENRLLILGFRYKFGNTRIRDNKKRKRVDERNRI